MALQHLRASTADKRPTPGAMADGQLAMNTNLASPGLFFKDSNGDLVKVGPVHVGTTAPNATPASGGQAGNSKGEQWLDTSGTNPVFKIWDGSAWQSEAGEFVNASGDTMTGALVMDNQQQIRFRETTTNGTNFIALQAPASVASDKTITLPDVTGTVVTTGDTGSVTSTMILDGTIVNTDINASAGIVDTKLATIATAGKVSNSATTAASANTASAIVARDASGNFSAGTVTASLTGAASLNVLKAGDTMTGALSVPLGSASAPSIYPGTDTNTGIYSPGADQVAISTNGTGRLFVNASGRVGIGTSGPNRALDISSADAEQIVLTSTAGSLAGIFFNPNGSTYTPFLGATGEALVAQTQGIERMRLDSSGGLQFKGAGTAGVTQAVSFNGSAPVNSLVIDSSGRVGLGTSSPAAGLAVGLGGSSIPAAGAATGSALFGNAVGGSLYGLVVGADTTGNGYIQAQRADGVATTYDLAVQPNGGRVGIGTTAPSAPLAFADTAGTAGDPSKIALFSATGTPIYGFGVSANQLDYVTGGSHVFYSRSGTTSTERARIDSSGRLLVGTSTARFSANTLEGTAFEGSSFVFARNSNNAESSYLQFLKSRGTSVGSNALVSTNDKVASMQFFGADGVKPVLCAEISAFVDGTPGTDDMPGRLVFSTTADGASSPTERMRISADGSVRIRTSDGAPAVNNVVGLAINDSSQQQITVDGGSTLVLNRKSTDGVLLAFRQDATEEGNISVSGTTISYNGAHLSRWSQFPGGAERSEILRGTVLSNIDEMCDWGEEDNEQLNRMKVSDVESDPNVAGVFQAWDDDDDTYTDDFYCAMTGDFIIRIGEGVTVHRGDLLMSAGDGTAKPQDDDIIRSKTVAKVTSNHVTCTYDDGSYCVPCVLMAC
jgi:hypothetical protein